MNPVILAFIALVCASCVSGQEEGESFPQIPSQFSATVVASFSDLGYTLSYTEYYDSLLGKSRTDGRMTFTHVREYIDWSSGTLYHYNGTFCGVYSLPANAINLPTYSPSSSMWFFKIAEDAWNNGNVQVLDETTTDRGILCRVFEFDDIQPASSDNGFIRTETSYTLYFSANSDQPISVFISGKVMNESNPQTDPQTYTHIYDWVNWVSVNQSSSIFELPAVCRSNPIAIDERPLFTLPNQSAVVPQPEPGSLDAPTIPSEFSMLLETVLEDDSDLVDSVLWQYDSRIQKDRVDYEISGREYDVPTAYIVHYNTSYYPGASVYYSTADNDALACYSDSDNTHLTPLTLSPLAKIHAGAVPELFSGSFVRNHSYIGRRDVRGVSADVFRANLVRTRNGITYTVQEDLFFFPRGWKFPGIPLAQYSEQLPMHIEVFGRFVDHDGVSQTYNETWNFFLLIPIPPEESVFNPLPLGCEILVPQTLLDEVEDTVLSPVAIFIIVVLSILGGGSVCYWWRSKRLKARFGFSHDTPDQSSAPTPTNATMNRANDQTSLPESRSHHSLLTPHALASDDNETHIEMASPLHVMTPTKAQGPSVSVVTEEH